MNKLEKDIPQLNEIMKSLLLDNGVEFSKFEELMKSIKEEIKKRFRVNSGVQNEIRFKDYGKFKAFIYNAKHV